MIGLLQHIISHGIQCMFYMIVIGYPFAFLYTESPKCISQDRSIFCLELEASSRPFSMVSAGVGVNAK